MAIALAALTLMGLAIFAPGVANGIVRVGRNWEQAPQPGRHLPSARPWPAALPVRVSLPERSARQR
jgi:hypothetical protein